MRHGWLILALVLMVLALSAAPVCAEDAGGHHDEGNIFKGFLDLTIWTIVVFLVLFFVLAKFAWKPMLTGLKEREDSIRSAVDEAKAAKDEAAKLRADLEAEKAKARAEAVSVRDEARRGAEQLRLENAAKAKVEAQAERERLNRDLELAKDQAMKDLWEQTAQLSTLVASKALKGQITIQDQNRLIEEALAELRGAADERQRVVASIQ